jgi:hypothetical protein
VPADGIVSDEKAMRAVQAVKTEMVWARQGPKVTLELALTCNGDWGCQVR